MASEVRGFEGNGYGRSRLQTTVKEMGYSGFSRRYCLDTCGNTKCMLQLER